jgi:hypothetical protein
METKQPNSKLKIRNQIIFVVILSILCLFAGLIMTIYWFRAKDLEKEATIKNKIIIQTCVNQIADDFLWYYKEAENFNTIISQFQNISLNYRAKYFSNLTKEFLINEPKANCFWVYLDSKDSNFINTFLIDNPSTDINYFDSRKTFDVSWYRHNEKITREIPWKFEEAMQEEYFVKPITEKRIFISEPYLYTYDYDNVKIPDSLKLQQWLTTISAPVLGGNRNIIGVTGMDVNLLGITDYISSISLNEETYLVLISQDAKYLFNPDPKLVGKKITDNPLFHKKDIDSISKLISLNEEFDYTLINRDNKKMLASYSIIYIPDINLKMTVAIIAPYSLILEPFNKLFYNIIICFVIAFFLIAAAIFYVSTYKLNDEYLLKKVIELEKEETYIESITNNW